jgi:hypothetical protein
MVEEKSGSNIFEFRNQHERDLQREIDACCNFNDLEAMLNQSGVYFKSRKKLIDYVRKAQHDLYVERFQKELLAKPIPDKIDDIPARVVKVSGTEYWLHGIAHSGHGMKLSNRTKTFIVDAIKKYDNPPEEDYRLEDGLNNLLGVNTWKSMNAMEAVLDQLCLADKLSVAAKAEWKSLVMPLTLFFFGKKYDSFKYARKAHEDERYLSICQEINDRECDLPVRLEVAALNKAPHSSLDAMSLVYSREMAGSLMEDAQYNHLKVMHGVMALHRVKAVAYFLATEGLAL